jgi:GT2 family glycosyltransferase
LGITREIILIGSEEGIAEAAADAGAIHVQTVRRDCYGTPMVDDIFARARERASANWLCYVNSDIILMPEFAEAVTRAITTFQECLVVARRWNVDIDELIDFDSCWSERLRNRVEAKATLFSPYGLDVFVFPKHKLTDIPPFSLGRPYWDNWMMFNARRLGYPVVDATQKCSVIHQNHLYPGAASDAQIRRGQQAMRNFWLAGDSFFGLGHAGDATHRFQGDELTPTENVTVSVVIPHAGTIAQLRSCLRALAEQSYPRTFVEVIVVDNAEQSVTAPVLVEFPFITLTRERKRGPAAARNKGAAISRGDILAFLDSDCRPAGNWLEKAVELARKEKLKSVVACNVKPWGPQWGSAGVKWYQALVYHNQKGFVETAQACITGGMLVPRNIWVSVGQFDEGFPDAACEDWEWSTRASSQGVRIVYAPLAVVSHPVHTKWQDLRIKARRLVRGELLLARKRGRVSELTSGAQHAAYFQRLRAELRRIRSNRQMRPWVKLVVALVACAVWFWNTTEVRSQFREKA